jgi:hypothetical protein
VHIHRACVGETVAAAAEAALGVGALAALPTLPTLLNTYIVVALLSYFVISCVVGVRVCVSLRVALPRAW